MPSNKKADNQYYGKFRECCVVAHLNNADIDYHENFEFTEEETKQLYDEAKLIADYLGNHTATYVGNHTGNASGDIVLDNGENVEIKCVSAGTGTYFNTSIYYFTKFGFDFKEYMKHFKLYDALIENFEGIVPISMKNNSPVTRENSSFIRHNYTHIYEEKIIPIDERMRKQFVEDIANYFSNNIDATYSFITDMLEKNSATSTKTKPDRLIVLNYQKKKIKEIDLISFKENLSTNIKTTDKGLVIGNIRLAISWQNGIGLNNPTIRVFLED